MLASATMRYVAPPKRKRPPGVIPTPRQAMGDLVDDLIAYRGLSITGIGNSEPNISPMTIHRIIDGVETVRPQKILALEGILGLPPRTLLLMAEGDTKAVAALEMPPDIKQMVMSTLATSVIKHNRRAIDA